MRDGNKDGNRVVLQEFDLDKVLADDAAFKKLLSAKGMPPTEAAKVLKDVNGVKMVSEKQITLEIK